jgi:hypothetical protein
MPPLAGKDFLLNWQGKSVGDLFEKTHTTMPATAPGTLTPAQAAELTAHMLAVGQYPAGTTELDSKIETLAQIKIDPPGAAGAAGTTGNAPTTSAPGAPAPTAPAPTAPTPTAPAPGTSKP